MNTHKLTRRTFLRGVGVTMALPWMESLTVWGDEPHAAKPASEAPVRLAVLFAGNGFHSKEWWARGEGKAMELGKVLTPLSDFRERLLFISGLFNAEALKGTVHSSQTGNLLSGAPLAPGGEIRSGTSIDQLLAQRYGRLTKVPSQVLACERSNPSVHKNYSMLYSSHISWSSPTTPTPLELFPALAFDRLFKDEATPGEKSVLDAVLSDAEDLRRNISRNDQRKLDSVQEGPRTLLDNTMLLTCSSMMAGAKHDNDQLPVMLLGGAGGRIQTGRTLDYKDKPERQMCRLFMSMMDKMEVRPKTF